ncbi:glucokinase [Desulfovibrio sp. TomC]|uniref:glucokinase n=1 Tax=Desulfovibrio sp. TomC TaxID=1562888 RepID=UPI000575B1A7|nr:glucokinase [Desulfovibrio sp. TomC]KHK03053.1 Glucokinase [Desulfovibrio sp. TomC]
MSQPATPLLRHILAADIGGTTSRFGHFTLAPDGALTLDRQIRLSTQAAGSFLELLDALPAAGFDLPLGQVQAAAFAVPGAMVGRTVHFANIAWSLDLADLERTHGLECTACVNDFLAQAHGCRLLGDSADMILPGAMDPARIQAVIGAGTGLGHAALIPLADGTSLALPSEAGQTAAPFFGPEETAFADYLARATGEAYVRGDSVLSGSGLAHLHRFVTGEDLTPAQISRQLVADSPTTAFFARFYGRAARDFALTVLAAGGVFISGGVAAKNPLLVAHPEFAREFHASPTYAAFLERIPVRLVRDENVGLYGAAAIARNLLVSNPSKG